MIDLHVFWYLGLGALITVYAVLDGFDLGVGAIHLFTRGDEERRISINSIGPLWDGNQVWLVTFGGALFAGFPEAYASILSAFYMPFMTLLFCLIGRAVSIKFRSKRPETWWRAWWDFSFAASSTMATFGFGLLAGNLVRGLPIDSHGVIRATFSDFHSPYALAVGALAVAGAAMHGSIFLYLKTEGEMQQRVHGLVWRAFFVFLALWLVVTIATVEVAPHALRNFAELPAAWGVVALATLAIANIPRAMFHRRPAYAFASSCATIAALCFLFGMAMFPNFVYARNDPSHGPEGSLDAWSAASSETTLAIMQIVAALGLPLVASYTALVYWVFRGKVKLGATSY